MNTDIELGWLIGIIDGEGCLCIRIRHGKTKHYGIRPRFQPQLTIANTEEEITDRCSRILTELSVKHRSFFRKRNIKNAKPQYCIDVYSTGLRTLLPLIKKHSAKFKQIDILIEALKLTEGNKGRGHKGAWGAAPITNEVLARFDDLRLQLTELHGRQSKSLIKLKATDYINEGEKNKAIESLKLSREKAIETNPKYQ